jgi:beta-lactamase class A
MTLALAVALSMNAAGPAAPSPERQFAALEASAGGRLGVAALDTGTGRRLAHRADERFAMCSTFKLFLAADVLSRVDAGKESLDRRVTYTAADLLAYAPVTKAHVKEGAMTVGSLCEAAVEESDNAAANLLLKSVGGPDGLTSYLKGLGDTVTRLDRNEPELNGNEPGDARDTTTPEAAVATMERILLGDALSAPSREKLLGWLIACKTGSARIRAGVPKSWRVGDKTGTGARGATNDVAILWPPGRKPILVAAYFSESKMDQDERNAILAEVGKIVAQEFAGSKADAGAGGK